MGGKCVTRTVGMLCVLLWALLAVPVCAGDGTAEAVSVAGNLEQLAQGISARAALRGCTAAIVVRDLQRGDAVYQNKDAILPAASLIKVPILVAAYTAVDRGELRLGDTFVMRTRDKVAGSGVMRLCAAGTVWTARDLLRLMIAKSDNTATDMLIARLGRETINARMRELGLTATRVRRNILDFPALRRGVENTTTAYEMARLLELIHGGRAASPWACREMLDILLAQEYNDRIPRFLPAGVAVAHKTGTMNRLTHDAGIVYVPGGGVFVITVLVQGAPEEAGEQLIGQVARQAYDYFAGAGPVATAAVPAP